MKSFKTLLPKGVKIIHQLYVGSLADNSGTSQITLQYTRRGFKTRLIDLFISDKYANSPEIGLYKGLTIADRSDYDRGIIKGDYKFVMETLADFNKLF